MAQPSNTRAGVRPRSRRRMSPTRGVLAGMKAPVLLLAVCGLVLAAISALWLGRDPVDKVARTELDVQRAATADVARSVRGAVRESATDLARSARLVSENGSADPVAVLELLSTYQKWRGLAVLSPGDGKILAARGETIPLSALSGRATDDLTPQILMLATGDTRVLATAWLTGRDGPDLLLVASSAPHWREFLGDRIRDIALVDRSGNVVASADGEVEPDAEKGVARARHAGTGVLGVTYAAEHGERRTTVVHTALRSDRADNGTPDLAVATVSRLRIDESADSSVLFGLAAAVSLLGVLGVILLALHRALLRPLRELHRDARRIARGEVVRPALIGGSRETARLGRALEELRVRVVGNGDDPVPARQRRRPGIRLVVSFCSVLLIGWSAAVGVAGNVGGDVRVPTHTVQAQTARTESTADAVSRALNEGLADLLSVATLSGESTSDEIDAVLSQLLRDHTRYRAVYVRDADRKTVARAGEDALANADPPPAPGVYLGADSGRIPVIAAAVPLPGDRRWTLIAEYDPFFVVSLLTREGKGRTWLVDDRARLLAANRGFIAYDSLPDKTLENAAKSVAAEDADLGRRDGEGRSMRIVAASNLDRGATAALRWAVVTELEASDLDLWPFRLGRQSLIIGIVGATLAVLFLGWIHLVLVRALRELTLRAEALADGDTTAV
ncbi:MAG TPA: cache domain-containing protein, partial [Yinghuangia sp.]|nr:cache domain-containing protein [Yinghuangia sp.]